MLVPLMTNERVSVSGRAAPIRADTIESWQELMSDSIVPVNVSSLRTDRFHGVVRRHTVGDVSVIELAAKPQMFERTSNLIAHTDKAFFIVTLQVAGTGMVLQDSREAVLRPGDFAIFDSNRAHTRTHETNFRSLTFRLPQDAMDLPRETIGQLTARRFAGDSGMGALIGPFLLQLAHNLDLVSRASQTRLLNNSIDLIATMLHNELGAHGGLESSPERSSLLERIHAFIDENLSQASLSPTDIARANFISTRHLHAIFHDQGITVSGWVRSRRLSRCRRDLADASLASRPIADIAHRWGFSDASQFSRVFRKTFGESARDVRKRAGL